jgi:hypothetical protein
MIYELRIYEPHPGKLQALHDRFTRHTNRLFEKHRMTVVGYWTPMIGEWSNQLIYMLAFADLAAREKAWAAFQADPEWLAAKAESEREGPLVARLKNQILAPTAYSPLK